MEQDDAMAALYQYMIQADRDGARQLVAECLLQGMAKADVIDGILEPALVRVGELWGGKQVSMAQAFVGAKIAEDTLLACLEPGLSGGRPPKGRVVIGNIEEDYHSLGRRMVGSFLEASGWEVKDLGNDVDAEVFVREARDWGARVICVSAMMLTTAMKIRKVRDVLDSEDLGGKIHLAVGGAVFNWRPSLVEQVGGEVTARNAGLVDPVLCKLLGLESGNRQILSGGTA